MIYTNSTALLFIEPKETKKHANRSNLLKYKWFNQVIRDGKLGTYNYASSIFNVGSSYLGVHTCVCGERSISYDILLPNRMVTNSLAYHYLVYHAGEVPEKELEKLEYLKAYLSLAINEQ